MLSRMGEKIGFEWEYGMCCFSEKSLKKIYVFVFFSIVCAFFSVTGNKLETKQVDRSKVVAHHATTRWLVSISVCRIFCIMYAFKFNLVIKVAVSRFVRRLRKGDWHREYWRCVIWQWLVMFAHPSSRAKHDAKQPRSVDSLHWKRRYIGRLQWAKVHSKGLLVLVQNLTTEKG